MEFLEMMNFIGFAVEEEKRRVLDEIVYSMWIDGIDSFDMNYIEDAARAEGIYLDKSDYGYLMRAFDRLLGGSY